MIVDRYYYHQLNRQEQAVYKAFYHGAMAHREIIPIPVDGEFRRESFERVFMAMTRDNPLIYFLNQSTCSTVRDSSGHVAIRPQYFFTREKVKEYNRKLEEVVNDLAGRLCLSECSDYEKELRIHDWICRNIEYDYEGADRNKLSRVIASHNILGVFAHHKAQCEGIAKAVKVLLNAVDVKCIVVTGDSVKGGKILPHAWNIVSIDGEPYQLDVTWDIGTTSQDGKYIAHDYFNLTDELMNRDHKADSKLPDCRSKNANYYVQNGCSFQMWHQLMAYIDRLISANERVFEFRAEESLNQSVTEKEISEHIWERLQEWGKSDIRIRMRSNRELGTHRIEIL